MQSLYAARGLLINANVLIINFLPEIYITIYSILFIVHIQRIFYYVSHFSELYISNTVLFFSKIMIFVIDSMCL